MEISSKVSAFNSMNIGNKKLDNKSIQDIASKVDAKALSVSYFIEFSKEAGLFSTNNISTQSALNNPEKLLSVLNSIDFEAIGYHGKPLSSLSQDEAKELISEDGFFGISQTSQRMSNFVLIGGGDNVEKLKQGREGMIRGYEEARRMWGGELPEISQKTLDEALRIVDKKLEALGESIVDIKA